MLTRTLSGDRPAADVVIVGAGAVGLAAALELAERGASVMVVERGPQPAAGCSFGNAGVVGASHVEPLASRETLREGLRWLRHRHGALGIAPSPTIVPWLARFVLASSAQRYGGAARVLRSLAVESAALHRRLSTRLETSYAQRGLLEVYETAPAFAAAKHHAARSPHDLRVLDGAAARERLPQLAAVPGGAILARDEAHCDPARFVGALAEAASGLGATIRCGVEVVGLRRRGDRVAALITTEGELPVGDVVLATGAWTPRIARGLPVTVPVQGGKGYHVEVPAAEGDVDLPTMFPERRVVVTPMDTRLRISGMLQVAGTDMRVDTARVDAIVRHARAMLTGLEDRPVLRVWRGLRPCTPDGLPLVGRVPGAENAILAAGHGMWGLQLAPVTARLVADVVADAADPEVACALRPDRFRTLRMLPGPVQTG